MCYCETGPKCLLKQFIAECPMCGCGFANKLWGDMLWAEKRERENIPTNVIVVEVIVYSNKANSSEKQHMYYFMSASIQTSNMIAGCLNRCICKIIGLLLTTTISFTTTRMYYYYSLFYFSLSSTVC